LYEFEVKVKPSRVAKNAGMGAFLIFRGTRVLKAGRFRANEKKYKRRMPVDPGTFEALEARNLYGSEILIMLTGKHLHGHNNSIFKEPTEKLLPAVRDGHEIMLRLAGKNLHYDSDEDETLGLDPCPKRIGLLGLNIASDYVRDDSRDFSFRDGRKQLTALLDLGRYGPWRKDGKNAVLVDG